MRYTKSQGTSHFKFRVLSGKDEPKMSDEMSRTSVREREKRGENLLVGGHDEVAKFPLLDLLWDRSST